jgi:stage III sporulation protein AH
MKNEKTKKILSSKTARSVVVTMAVLLIGLAVYLNYRWFYDPVDSLGYGDNNMDDNYSDSVDTGADSANDYFAAALLTRQQSRDEAIDVLTLVSSSADADEATKAEAQAKISRIATDIQNEANIEALVKAKGFEECVAVIGEGSVSVIVKAESLQAKETAQILSIVYETTGVAPENVSIINK